MMHVSLCKIHPDDRYLKYNDYAAQSDNLWPFDKRSAITIVMHFIDLLK